MSTSAKVHREPLDAGRIVAVAIEMADEEGVAALSMRSLADRLGYKVMSLYNHVANKDELLALMADEVAAEVRDPDPGRSPLEAVRDLAVSMHEALEAHPWAPYLWLHHPPGPARLRVMEQLLARFEDSALSPGLAHHGFHAVSNHVMGFTIQRQEMARDDVEAFARQVMHDIDTGEYPLMVAHIRQHMEGDTGTSFELVLDLILDGLVRLDAG